MKVTCPRCAAVLKVGSNFLGMRYNFITCSGCRAKLNVVHAVRQESALMVFVVVIGWGTLKLTESLVLGAAASGLGWALVGLLAPVISRGTQGRISIFDDDGSGRKEELEEADSDGAARRQWERRAVGEAGEWCLHCGALLAGTDRQAVEAERCPNCGASLSAAPRTEAFTDRAGSPVPAAAVRLERAFSSGARRLLRLAFVLASVIIVVWALEVWLMIMFWVLGVLYELVEFFLS